MTFDRRAFLSACSRAGVTSALFPGILYTLAVQAQEPPETDQSKPPKITPEMIDAAAVMAGIGPFPAEQKQMMIDGPVDMNGSYKAIRKLKLPNSVAPAFAFHPMPAGKKLPDTSRYEVPSFAGPDTNPEAPAHIEDVAFATVLDLGKLLRDRKITSLALTQMYI